MSLEGRAVHLATLVQEAEQRVSELQVQVSGEAPGEREGSDRDRQLKAWEWRLRLFHRMQTGFEHASKALHNFDVFSSRLCFSFLFFLSWRSVSTELLASMQGSPLYDGVSANATRPRSRFTFLYWCSVHRQAVVAEWTDAHSLAHVHDTLSLQRNRP